MNSVTALLLVLTLTGSPVSGAICAAWCSHPSTPVAHCHDTKPDSTGLVVVAGGACGTFTAEAPFVKDDGRASAAAVPAMAPDAFVPFAVVRQPAAPLPASPSVALKPPLVLRV